MGLFSVLVHVNVTIACVRPMMRACVPDRLVSDRTAFGGDGRFAAALSSWPHAYGRREGVPRYGRKRTCVNWRNNERDTCGQNRPDNFRMQGHPDLLSGGPGMLCADDRPFVCFTR